MTETHDLSHATFPGLFAELLNRKAYQSAFALFGRMANALSIGIEAERDAEVVAGRQQFDELLTEGQLQLGEMWRYAVPLMKGDANSAADRSAEIHMFRNLMETCVMAHAAKSEQNRDRFAAVIGGADSFKTLQEVPSESAPRWMMCQ